MQRPADKVSFKEDGDEDDDDDYNYVISVIFYAIETMLEVALERTKTNLSGQ